MDITITIDPAVESVGIQTIGKALGVTGSDTELKGHLANDLRKRVANLFVQGDRMIREQQAESSAVAAAEAHIKVK